MPVNFPGGSLTGFGSVNAYGGVNVGGTLSPGASPGTLTFAGFGGGLFMQPPLADLNIEIGGHVAGVEFDNVMVGGPASLGGTLNVSFINGFLPALGDSFEILHCSIRTNTFSSLNGLHAGNGLVLVPRYSNTNVVLVAANDFMLMSPVRTPSQFQFSFLSTTGFNYVVEFVNSLSPPLNWQPLGSSLPDTGGVLLVTDPSPPPGERFYRVRFQ